VSFGRLHDLVAYLLASLGLLALGLGGEVGGVTLVLVAAGVAGSAFVSNEIRSRRAWSRVWTALVVALLAVSAVRVFAGVPVLAVAVEFACFLQISRLMTRRDAGDYQQIAVLALLHLAAATVLSSDVGYAFVFLGFVIVTPWMLALSHLRREIEANYPAAPPPSAPPPSPPAPSAPPLSAPSPSAPALSAPSPSAPPPTSGRADVRRVLASRRVVGGRFLLGTAALGVPIFALSAVVFLLFPRVGLGILSFGASRTQRMAGFGDSVELGGFGTIRSDPTVIARVSVPAGAPLPPSLAPPAAPAASAAPAPTSTAAGSPARPPWVAIRLRGTAFDRYDGRAWSRTPGPSRPMMRFRSTYVLGRPPDRARDAPLRVVLEPLDESVVFLPSGAVALDVPARARGGVPEPRALTLTGGFDLRYEDRDALGLVYEVWTDTDGAPWPPDVPDAAALARLLEVPSGHERVAALARSIVGDTFDPVEKARRVLAHLAGGDRYRYTLTQPEVPADRLPLDVFLFEARAGHCEYFATAMAVMLRAVGVPTRTAAGLLGGRYNAYGDYYALRQGDAHSWVEVWDGARWHTFDPTPPAREAARPEESALASLDALLDALRTRWNTRVVGYDLEQQVALLFAIGRALRSLGGGDGDAASADRRGVRSGDGPHARRGRARALLPIVTAFAAVAVALVLARRLRARRAARAAPPGARLSPAASEARRLYEDLERALLRAGRPRPPHRTPREHARALAAEGFAGADLVAELTEAYLAARFGGAALDPAAARALRRKLRALAAR
jgi:transglutaminase-like putative cysteine protease